MQFPRSLSREVTQLKGRKVRMVVTCTDGKTIPARAPLRLRDHPDGVDDRAERWVIALESAPVAGVTASSLYKGEHWSIARSLPALAAGVGWDLELWVASAGYGLVRADAPLKPYAATFTNGQPDSVDCSPTRGVAEPAAQRWWSTLTRWRGPAPTAPRSLAVLAETAPDVPLVFVGSAAYLRAVGPDLSAAVGALEDADRLLVVSGGSEGPVVAQHRLPVDARLLHALGGTRISLNVRVAAHLVATANDHCFGLGRSREQLAGLLEQQPDLPTYDRLPLTDEEVRLFIENELEVDHAASQTALLRRLRDSARACEQKRFGALYREVLERITV